jgi:hypothetical protein
VLENNINYILWCNINLFYFSPFGLSSRKRYCSCFSIFGTYKSGDEEEEVWENHKDYR